MPRVLVVDDDWFVRESLGTTLRLAGHEPTPAADGDDALRKLEQATFDLVILDVIMPGRDGIETLTEIRKRWPDVPVLMISGGDQTGWLGALEVSQRLGAAGTLAKPFSGSELIAHVERLLKPG